MPEDEESPKPAPLVGTHDGKKFVYSAEGIGKHGVQLPKVLSQPLRPSGGS